MKTTSAGRLTKARLSRLTKKLKEGDNYDKEKAIEQLISFPGKKTVESVVPLLKEKDTQVRMAAWEILKRIGSSNIDAVVALLDDGNEDIRIYAVEILGGLKNSSTIPDLIRKTREENPNVRNIACMALGGFQDDERVVGALLDALKDDEWVAFSAIESLGKIGHKKAILPLLNVFKCGGEEISLASCEVLIDFHDEAVLHEILDLLKGFEQKKRDVYLKIILERGDADTFQRAKEGMGDEIFVHLLNCIELEEKKSLNLLRMVATFRRREACEAVLSAIKTINPEDDEYEESIHILLDLKDIWEKHVPEYMEKDEGYVLPLIRTCQMASVKTDEEALLKVFLSSTVEIKREIVKSIPVIVPGSGLSIIKEAMKDLDGHVKGDAMITAGRMSLNELKDEIEAAALKDFKDVRVKALNALILIDLGSAMDLIRKFVQEGSSDDKRVYLAVAGLLTGENNFPFIKKLLSDNDEKVRSAAASALGNFLDDERYMNIFVKQLKVNDIPHEVLKVIKERKLAMFKDRLQEIFEDVGRGLWTRYYALSALSSFEDGSLFDTFARGLKDENSIIKIGCLKALSDLNDVRALNYVMPFLQSDDEDIRSTAEFVMNKLEAF